MSKITNPTTESSVTCGFFNSKIVNNKSDRLYNAEQMSAIFDGLINDGVFASIGDNLVVTVNSGNTVNVGTGKCWFNHTWTLNNAPLRVDCGDPDNMPRIDAIVVEVDSVDERDNFIKVIKGTPSQYNTTKPTLSDNQHALCYITRKPGAAEITQADIENVVGTDETPFVTGIVQVTSLDKLLGQWRQELDDFIASGETKLDNFILDEKTDFKTWYDGMKQLMSDVAVELNKWTVAEKTMIINWFDEVKGKLSEDPALNLQIQIDSNEVERLLMEGLPDGTKTISEDGTVISSVDSKGRSLTKTFTNNFSTITSILKTSINNEYLKYPYSSVESGASVTVTGITFTDNGDRTITANGTASADTWFVLSDSTFKLPPGLYSVSGCPNGGSDTTYYYGISLVNDGTYVSGVSDYGTGVTLDTNGKTYTESRIFIRIRSGVTVNNLTFNPKVISNGATLGVLVKNISSDGKTINSTLTNYSDAIPNLVEIERGIDTIIATENYYIGGEDPTNPDEPTNLLSYPYTDFGSGKSVIISGVTFTDNDDGTITVNGTPTERPLLFNLAKATDFSLDNGTYNISGCPAGGSVTKYGIWVTPVLTGASSVYDYGSGATLNLSSQDSINVQIMIATTVNNLVFNPKIIAVN